MSNITAKKSLGQHWLEDQASLASIIESANLKPEEKVLEIGPGTGYLTTELLKTGAKITALEYDPKCYKSLEKVFGNKINLVQGDIRKFPLSKLPKNYKIVANIPYYLTANLLRKLVDESNKPSLAVLLIQKEVAQRLNAKPGDLSRLAVFVQNFYQTKLGIVIKPEMFTPPPKVDSQVIVLHKRQNPIIESEEVFYKIVNAGFANKRKKLKTSLSSGLSISKEQVEEMLLNANISPNARAQELSFTDWSNLIKVVPNN
jgi:16S rRNA (adenine1518-N6/adenine1519-N6)-dimethyltransferase